MTRSPLERMGAGLVAFLSANLPVYLARANLDAPTPAAVAPRAVKVSASIPGTGPFPFGQVNLDQAQIEPSGQVAQRITATYSVNFALAEANPERLEQALTRYADALVDLFGEDMTIGGVAAEGYLDSIDKAVLPADGKGFVVATARLIIETQT
jgi:hypothetical protein